MAESLHIPDALLHWNENWRARASKLQGYQSDEATNLRPAEAHPRADQRPGKTYRSMTREVSWTPKWYEQRNIPIEPRLLSILEDFHERRMDNVYSLYFLTRGGYQVTDHLSRQIKALTGKRDVSVHTFRHTHISHALNRWGRSPTVVQKWVGHKDLKTTMQYVHVSMDDLHREAQKTGN